MTNKAFSGIRGWVFDLDNTLYPPSVRLFEQIERRMTDWVATTLGVSHPEANRLRRLYWQRYGTTLAELMAEHEIDPHAYLVDVHDISFDALEPDMALAARIASLPGRRIVYTNGSAPYAERVLAARGLTGIFDAVYGVEHAGFLPKPERAAFEAVFARDGLAPEFAAMFEDDARNLIAPYALGMRTVHVTPEPFRAPHVHHHTDNLTGFLLSLQL